MTVLNLDPPPSPLRLVASDGQPTARDHRYRAGAQLGRDARILFREVLQSALESGASLDPDALRVVLATKQANHLCSIRWFSANVIWQLMFVEVTAWCRARHLAVPAGAVEALRVTIDHLDATHTLAAGSDAPTTLHDAIDECTGGWPETTMPPVSTRRRRSVRSARGPQDT